MYNNDKKKYYYYIKKKNSQRVLWCLPEVFGMRLRVMTGKFRNETSRVSIKRNIHREFD